MILHPTRQAARRDVDALALAKTATPVLLQNACSSFAEMLAHMTGQRITVWIGSTPIARGERADAA